MKKNLIALIILIHSTVYGGENSSKDTGHYVAILSSDKFAGRLSGSVGAQEAGDYIVNEFMEIGLLPVTADSYFQLFDIPLKSLGKNNWLVISGKELKVLEDYVPLTVCPSGEVREKYDPQNALSAEAGIQNTGKDLDSHLRGNDVHLEAYSREDIPGGVAIVQYDETVPDGAIPGKIREAEETGAKALVILKRDLYSDYTVWKELIPPKLRTRWGKLLKEDFTHFLQMKVTQKRYLMPPVTSKIPCLLVREDRITKNRENPPPLMGGGEGESEQRGLAPLPLIPSREGRGKDRVFSDEVTFKVDIAEEKIPVRNIIGYLPGKGDHKDEVVIIGAHYDHLGQDSKGRPFPGADDNASGVAAMLEVAKRLSEKGPLRRGVVFIAFDGEEWGLTGSRYYVGHPSYPLDKTVLMINMDTIGRNEPDAIHFLGSQRSPDVRRLAGEIADKGGIKLLDDIEFAFKYGSDHYPFYEQGVPAIDLTSSYHEDFHQITDTPDKVNADKVSKIADLVYRLTLEAADSGVYFQKPIQVDIPFPEQRQ